MATADSLAHEGLWAFSLQVYSRPGVAPACLSLQDRRGTDVNLLLHALWCGARGYFISPVERQTLCEAVSDWHENVVKPLRHARRWMKGSQTACGPEAAALRQAIKKQELQAERLEQQLLEATLTPTPAEGSPPVAAQNLLGLLSQPSMEDLQDLVVLLASLWPQADMPQLQSFVRPT